MKMSFIFNNNLIVIIIFLIEINYHLSLIAIVQEIIANLIKIKKIN